MMIALVGGIFGKRGVLRATLQMTPEIVLENGIRESGHSVDTFGHHDPIDYDRYEIVHVHHFALGALRAASASGMFKFVYTSHDGQSLCGLNSGQLRIRGNRYVMARADAVVALSEEEATFQRMTYDLEGVFHQVIPNGINPSYYWYERLNKKGMDGPWRLLYVGQLISLKNVEVLLKAVSMIPIPAEVELIYQVDTLRDQLQALAGKLGLGDRVLFTGPIPSGDLCRKYQSADALVLPSSAESLPSVVTEAMVCGTPVISSDVGGVRSQIGPFGILVPPQSAERLAEAIVFLFRDYDRFEREGKRMSEHARERFSMERMIQSHIDLYKALPVRLPRRRGRQGIVPSRWVNWGAEWQCRMKSSGSLKSTNGRPRRSGAA